MRLLQIHFKNLNSLAGEWCIDLTDPAYLSDGIFAITGPTGAGKSTILDAICLALYGRTPRLNRINATSNEIMSRQTGECFAEVTFQTQKGRYRSRWSQRRARKQPGGNLQPARQEVSHADTGQVIETGLNDAASRVEEVTGLNFDRFTRSILLAQGGFAAFLNAAASERADILEQITGTELYSDISRHVHELHTAQQNRLRELEAGMRTDNLLTPEQEEQLQQEIKTGLEEETRQQSEHKNLQDALTWLEDIDNLQKELTNLQTEAADLEKDHAAFQPQRAALALAEKAATLEGAYATLQSLRQQQEERQAELTKGEASLPALQQSLQQQAQALSQAKTRTEQARKAAGDAASTIRAVFQLDHDIMGKEQDTAKAQERCKKTEQDIAACQRLLAKTRNEQQQAQTILDETDAYLKTHEQDGTLAQELPALRLKLDALAQSQRAAAAKEAEQKTHHDQLTKARSRLVGCETARKEAEAVRDQARTSRETAQNALDELLKGRDIPEYHSERDRLLEVRALRQRVRDLEAERAHLVDGTPCPLCGAEEHPYAHGNIPPVSEVDEEIATITRQIAAAAEQQKTLEGLKARLAMAEKELSEASTQYQLANKDCETARQSVEADTAQLESLRETAARQEGELQSQLAGFSVPVPQRAHAEGILSSLQQRRDDWQNQTDRRTVFKEKQDKLTAAIQAEMTRQTTLSEHLTQQRSALTELATHLAESRQKRHALFGERDPQEEEKRLGTAISQAEQMQADAASRHETQQEQYSQTRTRCATLQEQLTTAAPQLAEQGRVFLVACREAGLEDEAHYRAVSLPPQQRGDLARQARLLDERSSTLADRQQDRQSRLQQQQERTLTTSPAEALAEQKKTLEDQLATLQQSRGQLAYRLKQHEEAKEHQKAQLALMEAQRRECRRWQNLHELIGSSDGKKYRNFAQGLTFEIMIRHANQQLAKMTDRYLLTRNSAQPLELNVIDNYQAGEMRSTKNLSGGESFLVSLTLALGMSQMASHTVQIDSLFLDEGFGTLDEDALDSALETLATLQEDGKIIGIISHVEALKERITTQIRITPQRGGKSQLSGPGIEHKG